MQFAHMDPYAYFDIMISFLLQHAILILFIPKQICNLLWHLMHLTSSIKLTNRQLFISSISFFMQELSLLHLEANFIHFSIMFIPFTILVLQVDVV